jgi:hypothetical protein
MSARIMKLSIRTSLGFGWTAFRARPGFFAGIFATLLASWAGLEVLVVASQRLGVGVNLGLHLLFLLFFSGLKLGLFRIALATHDGGTPAYDDLFASLRGGPRLLGAGLLYLLGVIVGLAALVVPGVYVAMRFSQFGFAMAADDLEIAASFRRSGELTRGALPTLLGFSAALVAINLAGAALLGVGLFVSVPVTVLAMASVFRQLEAGGFSRPPDL